MDFQGTDVQNEIITRYLKDFLRTPVMYETLGTLEMYNLYRQYRLNADFHQIFNYVRLLITDGHAMGLIRSYSDSWFFIDNEQVLKIDTPCKLYETSLLVDCVILTNRDIEIERETMLNIERIYKDKQFKDVTFYYSNDYSTIGYRFVDGHSLTKIKWLNNNCSNCHIDSMGRHEIVRCHLILLKGYMNAFNEIFVKNTYSLSLSIINLEKNLNMKKGVESNCSCVFIHHQKSFNIFMDILYNRTDINTTNIDMKAYWVDLLIYSIFFQIFLLIDQYLEMIKNDFNIEILQELIRSQIYKMDNSSVNNFFHEKVVTYLHALPVDYLPFISYESLKISKMGSCFEKLPLKQKENYRVNLKVWINSNQSHNLDKVFINQLLHLGEKYENASIIFNEVEGHYPKENIEEQFEEPTLICIHHDHTTEVFDEKSSKWVFLPQMRNIALVNENYKIFYLSFLKKLYAIFLHQCFSDFATKILVKNGRIIVLYVEKPNINYNFFHEIHEFNFENTKWRMCTNEIFFKTHFLPINFVDKINNEVMHNVRLTSATFNNERYFTISISFPEEYLIFHIHNVLDIFRTDEIQLKKDEGKFLPKNFVLIEYNSDILAVGIVANTTLHALKFQEGTWLGIASTALDTERPFCRVNNIFHHNSSIIITIGQYSIEQFQNTTKLKKKGTDSRSITNQLLVIYMLKQQGNYLKWTQLPSLLSKTWSNVLMSTNYDVQTCLIFEVQTLTQSIDALKNQLSDGEFCLRSLQDSRMNLAKEIQMKENSLELDKDRVGLT
ncbi:hypothetical protein SNEBB_008910, partial [Seison nebaliae]